MKTTVTPEKTKKELPFPKLMIGTDGEIVLFSARNEGIVVHGEISGVGYFSNQWAMSHFRDFYSSITMSNL